MEKKYFKIMAGFGAEVGLFFSSGLLYNNNKPVAMGLLLIGVVTAWLVGKLIAQPKDI